MGKGKPSGYRYTTSAEHEGSSRGLSRAFLTIFSVTFVLGGMIFGYIFVVRLKTFLAPPGVYAPAEGPGGSISRLLDGIFRDRSVGSPSGAARMDDKERINILLLGVDQRAGEAGQPTRTDSMIVATIDPYAKSAGMLSVERDLWVKIPLDEANPIENKINTAFFYGDWRRYPGGGPALAMKTIEYNFGLKIHHYAVVDFAGLRRLVDALGGIDVDVPAPLRDDEFPTDDGSGGTMSIQFPAGRQHLNGERALQYARTRHQDSDFGRMKRQRQVLLALRDRALQLDVIPRLPQLAVQYRDVVKTDMSVQEIVSLASIAKEIPAEKIASRAIEGDACYPSRSADGADIQVPVWEEIDKILAEVFPDPRLQEEDARVEVLNGARVAGLAAQAAAALERRGFKRVSIGDVADGKEYSGVSIITYTGKKYTAERLAEIFKVPPQRIEDRREPTSPVDVRVILGKGTRVP